MISEAWGFRHGDDVEYRCRWLGLKDTIGVRDIDHPQYEWHRAKVVAIHVDRTLTIKIMSTGNRVVIHNPRTLKHWKPPTTLEEIERFLAGES